MLRGSKVKTGHPGAGAGTGASAPEAHKEAGYLGLP